MNTLKVEGQNYNSFENDDSIFETHAKMQYNISDSTSITDTLLLQSDILNVIQNSFCFWGHQVNQSKRESNLTPQRTNHTTTSLTQKFDHSPILPEVCGNDKNKEMSIDLKNSNDDNYQQVFNLFDDLKKNNINRKKTSSEFWSFTSDPSKQIPLIDRPSSASTIDSAANDRQTKDEVKYSGVIHKSDKPQKVVEANALNNIKQEITKFGRRFDVVKKTIFRKVKKHLSQQFKAFYDFSKRRRSSKLDYNAEIFGQAHKFAQTLFGDDWSAGLGLVLVAMIDVKAKYKHSSDEFSHTRAKLLKLIKWFNLPLMEEIIQNREYARLVVHWLSDSQFWENIVESKSDVVAVQRYREQIEVLKAQCWQAS